MLGWVPLPQIRKSRASSKCLQLLRGVPGHMNPGDQTPISGFFANTTMKDRPSLLLALFSPTTGRPNGRKQTAKRVGCALPKISATKDDFTGASDAPALNSLTGSQLCLHTNAKTIRKPESPYCGFCCRYQCPAMVPSTYPEFQNCAMNVSYQEDLKKEEQEQCRRGKRKERQYFSNIFPTVILIMV